MPRFRPADDPDDPLTPPGPYDGDDEGDDAPLPWLRDGGQQVQLTGSDWLRAQSAEAVMLARVSFLAGQLSMRLQAASTGMAARLAMAEAVEIGWRAGDRVTSDRLALWMGLRLSGAQEDPLSLARVAWSARRLAGGPGPTEGWAAFLDRPVGGEDVAALQAIVAGGDGLHPIVQAAALFWYWRAAGPPRSALTEAAVMASRQAAGGPGAAPFLPLALGGGVGLRGGRDAATRLAAWLSGAASATQAALRMTEQVLGWEVQALAALSDLSGRTPALLVACFAHWPAVSAPFAEIETGASRAAVQRNIDRLVARGLIREITGHGRFRIWTAALTR